MRRLLWLIHFVVIFIVFVVVPVNARVCGLDRSCGTFDHDAYSPRHVDTDAESIIGQIHIYQADDFVRGETRVHHVLRSPWLPAPLQLSFNDTRILETLYHGMFVEMFGYEARVKRDVELLETHSPLFHVHRANEVRIDIVGFDTNRSAVL